jgi:hypothetical protein
LGEEGKDLTAMPLGKKTLSINPCCLVKVIEEQPDSR